jgi:hypothetical protein
MTIVKQTLQNDTDVILIYDMSVMTEEHISPMSYTKDLGNLIYCELPYTLTQKSNTTDIQGFTFKYKISTRKSTSEKIKT